MRFLGIDAGATYLKGAVLDAENLSVSQAVRCVFPPLLNSASGLREVDPSEIVHSVAALLDRLHAAAPDAAGVVMCGQMHGMVLTSESGAALSRFISWQDGRATQSFGALASRISNDVRQECGNELRASLPVSVLFHLKENGELPTGAFVPAALTDFVAAHLCRTRPVTSPSNAAAHGCMDIARGQWHSGMLAAAGLQSIGFPEIVADGACVGYLPARWGSMPCYVAVGDQQAALLGASLECGELSLNIATGSQASLLTADPTPGDYQVRPYFGEAFLRTITHIPAGRALNLLVRLLNGGSEPSKDAWLSLEAAAREVQETSLQVDLSFFPGAMGNRGSISNITEHNLNAGHLFRAALESMAANYEQCATRLSPAREWNRLVFSGGLVGKSRMLRDSIVKRFACAYRVAQEREDTLRGLAVLAARYAGAAQLSEAAR